MDLTFEACLGLAGTNPDYSFEKEDIPFLKEAFSGWLPGLEYQQIKHGADTYALIFLPNQVEQEISGLMFENPSLAWGMASLAYIMLRLKARDTLGTSACLPVPHIDNALASELEKKQLYANDRIKFRFSLFTYEPARQDCSGCSLKAECPQKVKY